MSTLHERLKQRTEAAKASYQQEKQWVQNNINNAKSAAAAARLDNPISSPSLMSKATTSKPVATTAPRPGNVLDSSFKTPNYVSNNAMTEMVDRAGARVALRQDNTAAERARDATRKSAEQQKAAMERMMDDLYKQMEVYRVSGQTGALEKANQEYAKLNEGISQMNSKIQRGTLEDAQSWEVRQYNEMLATGGRSLLAQMERLAELSDARLSETVLTDGRETALPDAEKQYRELYDSLKSKYGKQVDDWLEYAKRMSNQAEMAAAEETARRAAEQAPFWSSAGSIPLNLLSGAGYLDVAAQKLKRTVTGSDAPIDYNSPAQSASRMTNTIRGTVSEDMGDVGRFLYNTGMSMGDTLLAMPMGGFGMTLLGGAAATSAMQSAAERGATDNQALMVGLLAGAMETIMEKASIDRLFALKSPEAARDAIMNILKQAGAEGTEEGLTTIANTLADAFIMGDKSELKTNIRDLIAQGYSKEEAERIAGQQWVANLGLDILGGMASGGMFAGGKATIDTVMPRLRRNTQTTEQTATPTADITPKPLTESEAPARPQLKIEPVQAQEQATAQAQVVPDSQTRPNIETVEAVADQRKPAMGAADSGFDPYSHASLEYGAIEPGETPARVVDVPKSVDGESNVMQTVRTIMEADATPDAAIPGIEEAIVKGKFSAMPITDRAAADRAEQTIRSVGYQQALADWRAEVRTGKVSKDSVAIGETLYNAAVNAKDYKSAVKIAVELSTQVRSAAQALQAVRMLKKMTPSAQLYGIKQSVDNLQKTLTDKYGDRAPNLTIDEELAAKFLEAETEADRNTARAELYKDIAKQIPATFADKWNAWRYLSMLGNARTHIRNIAGNAMFAPVRFAKDKVGAALEAGAQAAGFIDKSHRTKSFGPAGKELLDAARADYANVEQQVLSAGKYNSSSDIIEQNRKIFDNVVLETLRKGNTKALEAEDSFFSKSAYASALAGYLKAQGFTAADFTGKGMTAKQKDAARAYAIKEAQKATYRDINGFSEAISSIGFKRPGDSKTKHAVNAVVEGVMPFKKTPANILVRGMEYSPAGLAKALFVDSFQVKNGKITAAEYMDRLASGLTGTALFGLGWLLSNMGMLVGGTPEDEDQADLEGRQPYALEVGDTSITLDWLAPEAMPVFMGVELAEAIREGGGDASLTDKALSFLKGLSGPILEMSMMSSLQDALEATEYADNKLLAFLANGALGYLRQAQPTLFGQLERALESPVRQTTFTQDGDKYLNKDAQYMLGSVANKIPIYDYNQIPYIDAWGRTENMGGVGGRLFNNLLNPAYVSDIQETPVDAEIKRLEQALGINLTPSRADKTIIIDKKKIFLTADEYLTYAQAKGQNDFQFRSDLMESEAYQEIGTNAQAKAHDLSEELADIHAKMEAGFDPKTAPDWQKELYGADKETITNTLTAKALESQLGTGAKRYEDMADYAAENDLDAVIRLMLSDEQREAYDAPISESGVSLEQFLDALAFEAGAKSEKKDGKTIPGSKKEKVEDYINGLPLNRNQKIALYLSMPDGYSKKTMPRWR